MDPDAREWSLDPIYTETRNENNNQRKTLDPVNSCVSDPRELPRQGIHGAVSELTTSSFHVMALA